MTFEDLDSWQKARNPVEVGKLLTGLIRSTEKRLSPRIVSRMK